jgi:SpoVK/Ycf46/Vps4 family AAA+-type ATPase
MIGWVNAYLPTDRQLTAIKSEYHNILLIAATNRGDSLDAALVRPGRFDRRLYFDVPTKQGRVDLIDWFLDRKSHHQQLDDPQTRERIAYETFGYTPVMIEHLFDEGMLVALREGRRQMNFDDVMEAKLNEEIGLKQPVARPSPRTRPATPRSPTSWGRTVASRCCRSSSGVDRSACLRTVIPKSGSPALAARSSRGSRSPWEAWWPRSCASVMQAPDPRATSRMPPASPPAWSDRSAWRGR